VSIAERLGLTLIVAGFVLVLVGALLVAVGAVKGATSGSIVIFIGPIPIVVGWGGGWLPLLLASLAILAVMLLIAFMMVRGVRL